MKWLITSALLSAAFVTSPAHAAQVVAIFEIEDGSGVLDVDEIEQLTMYLTAQLAQPGRFTVVPRAEVRQALRRQKKESYKACYDDSCQIDIGRELAAQKVVQTKIILVGSLCAVTATLIDLAKSTTDLAATRKVACHSDAIVGALERISYEIARVPGDDLRPIDWSKKAPRVSLPKPKPPTPPPPPKPPAVRAPPMGAISVLSTPAGATVRVDGKEVGKTPLVLEQQRPGPRTIQVDKEGHLSLQISAPVNAKQQTRLAAKLISRPSFRDAEARYAAFTGWGWTAMATAVASVVGAGALFLLSPTEASIRSNEYDMFLTSRSLGSQNASYEDVESRVGRHNLMNISGFVLSGLAVVLGSVSMGLLLGRELPERSSADVANLGSGVFP